MRIEMTINGTLYYADVPPMKPLLSVLREDLGFKGSKEGCGEGEGEAGDGESDEEAAVR